MYEYRCIIKRVVDGDTVDVDIDLGFDLWLRGQRIRLYGIDTPESRTSDKVEKVFGKLAAAFVEAYLVEGESAILRTKKDAAGKYGRILGEFPVSYEWEGVTINTTVNKLLVDHNLAVAYFGQSKESIAEQHLKNRELANTNFKVYK
jgi:micrococcal nuclease